MRNSGRFPFCGRGDINTYAVFAETARDAIAPDGRTGVIVPSGIATDDTTKYFFGDLVETETLAELLSFENEEFIFPGVHHSYCFSLMVVSGRSKPVNEMEFVFFARRVSQLDRAEGRRFILTAEDIRLLNPNTLTCPVFRSERDAEITKGIYRRVPVLIREARDDQPASNPWESVSYECSTWPTTQDCSLIRRLPAPQSSNRTPRIQTLRRPTYHSTKPRCSTSLTTDGRPTPLQTPIGLMVRLIHGSIPRQNSA